MFIQLLLGPSREAQVRVNDPIIQASSAGVSAYAGLKGERVLS